MKSLLRLFMLLVVVVASACSLACNMVFGLDELVLKQDAGSVPGDGRGDVATDGAGGTGANDVATDPSDINVAADVDATTIADGGDAAPDSPPIDGGRTDTPTDISNPPADAPRDAASDAGAADGDAPLDNGSVPTDATDAPPGAPDAGDASDGGIVDPLMSIAITPANSSVAQGSTRQLTATGTYAVSGAKNITTLVNWSTGDPTVADVGNTTGSKGVVSGTMPGTTTVTAVLGGVNGTTNITVTTATLMSIAVTPSNSTVPLGRTVAFTATGTFSDTSTQDVTASATWTATAGVASMNSAPCCAGVASTVGLGTATITAAIGSVSGSTNLTVGPAVLDLLAVTPPNPSVYVGGTAQFTATGTYSDNSMANLTTSVAWQSNSPGVANVSNVMGTNGLATGVSAGTATISNHGYRVRDCNAFRNDATHAQFDHPGARLHVDHARSSPPIRRYGALLRRQHVRSDFGLQMAVR
jgi:hypothetical protein